MKLNQKLIAHCLKADYVIGVWDGEDWQVNPEGIGIIEDIKDFETHTITVRLKSATHTL